MASVHGRTLERIWALDLLFAAEVAGQDVDVARRDASLLFDVGDEGEAALEEPVSPFAWSLFEACLAHRDELDALIASASEHWSLERIPPVDKNLLRLALCELGYVGGIPEAVTINECVELAKVFADERSGEFVNGILGELSRRGAAGEESHGRA